MGGADTIKVGTSNVDATILNLDPSSVLDLPGSSYYYTTPSDGISITNGNNFNLKLLGTTSTAIFANSDSSFTSLDKQSTGNGEYIPGTSMADNIVIAHSNCQAYGYSGDDFIIAYGDGNYLYGGYDDDTIITTGNNNSLLGGNSGGQNVFIVGGSNNSLEGSYASNNTFEIYSYTAGGSNNTLTGNNGYNTYIMSTGLVGVDGAAVNTAAYNPNFNDTVTVTITDAKSGDSYYMRDLGLGGINMSTTSDGVVISSTSGRITVTMKDQRDWNAVKTNLITLDNAQGNVGTYTLEQAVGLTGFNSLTTPPAGVFTNGEYLMVSSSFVEFRRQPDYVVDGRELQQRPNRHDGRDAELSSRNTNRRQLERQCNLRRSRRQYPLGRRRHGDRLSVRRRGRGRLPNRQVRRQRRGLRFGQQRRDSPVRR